MAIAPSPQEFRRLFPEFTDVKYSDDVIAHISDVASEIHNASYNALTYLIAHLLTLESEHVAMPDGGSGVVMKERIGPREVEYITQARTGRDTFFARTSYGRQFLVLEQGSPSWAVSTRVF